MKSLQSSAFDIVCSFCLSTPTYAAAGLDKHCCRYLSICSRLHQIILAKLAPVINLMWENVLVLISFHPISQFIYRICSFDLRWGFMFCCLTVRRTATQTADVTLVLNGGTVDSLFPLNRTDVAATNSSTVTVVRAWRSYSDKNEFYFRKNQPRLQLYVMYNTSRWAHLLSCTQTLRINYLFFFRLLWKLACPRLQQSCAVQKCFLPLIRSTVTH